MSSPEQASTRVVRTVGEFTNGLIRWFKDHRQLQNVSISGEVSGLKEFGGHHLGFTLKEEQAVLECVMWADNRRNAPELVNGQQAIATGNVRIRHERSGYQLVVDAVELAGLGDLFQLYKGLKEKFRKEGLFETGRKRAVPELPRRVALISARGKAKEDFEGTIRRSVPFVEVQFVETRLQGLGAEVDIAEALDVASRANPDVIVLTRGGGTPEDLFPFNLESVIRAIVRATAPVLTAIGHSDDHQLADDVADMTFGTPSLAAEHIARGWLLAQRRLQVLQRDLVRAVRDALGRGGQRAEALRRDLERAAAQTFADKRAALARRIQRLEPRNPQRFLADVATRVAICTGRLDGAGVRLLSRKSNAWTQERTAFDRALTSYATNKSRGLERARSALEALDPLSPLSRGYAIVDAKR